MKKWLHSHRMKAKEVHVTGYDALMEALAGLPAPVFVLFSGSKDSKGQSWCPDCVAAEPVIAKAAEALPPNATLVHCDVGERSFWKDQSNPFRTDPKLKLSGVPTLIKWNTSNKLVEEQCQKPELVEMLFED